MFAGVVSPATLATNISPPLETSPEILIVCVALVGTVDTANGQSLDWTLTSAITGGNLNH